MLNFLNQTLINFDEIFSELLNFEFFDNFYEMKH